MTAYWTCIACTTIGDTDRSAETHTRKTGHCTLTGIDPAVLARVRARITSGAAAARMAGGGE